MFAPESPAALAVSIPGRAVKSGLLELVPTDIRAFSDNKHRKTDDRPFGGGPGMVMMCQPLWDAVQEQFVRRVGATLWRRSRRDLERLFDAGQKRK